LITETIKPLFKEGIPIIVVGPSLVKEMVANHLRDTIPGSKITVLSASAGGMAGIREALSKGESLQEIMKRNRVVIETQAIDDLFSRIGKGSGATYGPDQVRSALSIGAVEMLLISDEVFRSSEGKEMIDLARSTGSGTLIVSSHHDLGKRFARMGGIAALLRFDPGGKK
jgi:protein pelota